MDGSIDGALVGFWVGKDDGYDVDGRLLGEVVLVGTADGMVVGLAVGI